MVLYNVPIRYLVMLFGVHKFSKKLLRPNAIPNNELLDFLSRVPDTDQLVSEEEPSQAGTRSCLDSVCWNTALFANTMIRDGCGRDDEANKPGLV